MAKKKDQWLMPDWEDVAIDRTDSEQLAKESKQKDKYILNKLIAAKEKHLIYHRKQITAIDQVLTLPLPGEAYELATQKAMNAFSLILFVLRHEVKIKQLYVTTFNMNEITLKTLVDLFDKGVIENLSFCISESVRFRMPVRFAQFRQAYKDRADTGRFRVALTWNHSKICLLDCGPNYYVIKGSGNFSDNAEIEEYTFKNDQNSFDWWQTEIMEGCIFNKTKNLKRHEIWK